MLRDLDILNIDYSAANAEYRRTEYHKTNELTGNYLIPFEGPMFVRNMVVRADGSPLTIETDYTIEDDFEELEVITGKKVIGCIKLSNRILTDYKEIKIVYQKVGEVIISRNFLFQSVDQIVNSDRPVDWLTEIFGKPATYPPAYHIHDIREKDELIGFSDLLLLFKQASGDIKRSGLVVWNELKVIEDKAFKDLDDTYKYLWDLIFKHIMDVTNPHNITKSDLGLGNHPNYATATFEEDQAAAFYTYPDKNLRGDVISTPYGVKSAIDNFDTSTDGYIQQGSLPFSYYGSGFYLPPPIKGSFEGLGTNLGTGCGCLESNGVFTVLARGYDSKVRSLYYYYTKNPYEVSGEYIFSGVKYDHPLVKADNEVLLQQWKDQHGGSDEGYIPLELNHVISGSSGLILMLGDYEKNVYYIGLGNGTLDYNSHVLKRVDLSSINIEGEGNIWDSFRSCVMMVGDYVYIIAQTDKWPSTTPESAKFGVKYPIYRMRGFFRINKSQLSDNSSDTVSFKHQLITYTDTDNVTHKSAPTVDLFPTTIGTAPNGKPYCKRLMVDWTEVDPDFTEIYLTPYHCQWVFKQNPESKNEARIRMLHGIQYWYYGKRTIGANMWSAVPMNFNAETNTLTLDSRWFTPEYDVVSGNYKVPEDKVNEGLDLGDWFNQSLGAFIGNHDEVGAAWIDNIGLYSIGARIHGLPYSNCFCFWDNKNTKGIGVNQWALFDKTYIANGLQYYQAAMKMDSPFGFTSMPSYVCDLWYCDGVLRTTPIEMFKALNRDNATANFYRIADDIEYQIRDDLKFPYIGKTVYSRAPNANFGTYQLEDIRTDAEAIKQSPLNLKDRFLPMVNITVRDQRSVQYGVFRMIDNANNGTYPYMYNELYWVYNTANTMGAMDSTGGAYIDTLATHTLNPETNIITLKPDLSGRLWITKDFWRGLIKILLGSNDDIAGTNGIKGAGEYDLSVFMAQPLVSNGNIPISMAMLTWHRVSTDPTVAKMTRTSFMTFKWKSGGKDAKGFDIPVLESYNFPSKDWGGNGDGGTTTFERFDRDTSGKWGNRDLMYAFPSVAAAVQIYTTDQNNYECFFSSGMSLRYIGGLGTPTATYRVKNGVITESSISYNGIYTIDSISSTKQAVWGKGLLNVINGRTSGGSVLYTQMPNGEDAYALLEAVFVKGNWTLFIGTDLEVLFNGHVRTLKTRNYSLDQLGIDPANKTFYLYAVCGKTEGYYDLTLSERTASPYHMLVATIVTISTGIKTIDINQVFAISGFTISTQNKGGIVPATTGTYASVGKLSAVVKDDLFDSSKY